VSSAHLEESAADYAHLETKESKMAKSEPLDSRHPARSRLALPLACMLFVAFQTAGAGGKINNQFSGLAIAGYDPVAYFTRGEPTIGSEAFRYDWLGATWHFVNKEHQQMFMSEPTKFAPQFGGRCASGMAEGLGYTLNPEAWRIVDQKLYFFYDQDTAIDWELDIPGNLAKADVVWLKRLGNN